jgi:hypothetical protein
MATILYSPKYKAMYIHLPKCGGVFTKQILYLYGFKPIISTRYDHDLWNDNLNQKKLEDVASPVFLKKLIVEIRNKGILRYYFDTLLDGYAKDKQMFDYNEEDTYKYSINVDLLKEIQENWDNIYKFCCKRNPYERVASAYTYCKGYGMICCSHNNFTFSIQNKQYMSDNEYFHFISCHDHLLLPDNTLCKIDKFLDFKYLNRDLIEVLRSLGIETLHDKHIHALKENTLGNANFKKTNIVDLYNNDNLRLINEEIRNDLKLFDINVCSNLEELKALNDKFTMNEEEYILMNKQLLKEFISDTDELSNVELDNGLVIDVTNNSDTIERITENDMLKKYPKTAGELRSELQQETIERIKEDYAIKNKKHAIFVQRCKGKTPEEIEVIKTEMGIKMIYKTFKLPANCLGIKCPDGTILKFKTDNISQNLSII